MMPRLIRRGKDSATILLFAVEDIGLYSVTQQPVVLFIMSLSHTCLGCYSNRMIKLLE
ncbi:hypothetical protein J6590_074019 [Homalodisca vitripennis]|nr:hypothetical protein J6590_074019 [Homalodisca vitripennis]